MVVAKCETVYRDSHFIRLKLYTDYPERIAAGAGVFIELFDQMRKLEIEEVVGESDHRLIKFKNFDTGDECSIFPGKYLYIPESSAAVLPADSYYIHDLIGSQVILKDGPIGTIKDVLLMPANDVYVVDTGSSEKEMLIPALKTLIENFDRDSKTLTMNVSRSFFSDED